MMNATSFKLLRRCTSKPLHKQSYLPIKSGRVRAPLVDTWLDTCFQNPCGVSAREHSVDHAGRNLALNCGFRKSTSEIVRKRSNWLMFIYKRLVQQQACQVFIVGRKTSPIGSKIHAYSVSCC